MISTIQIYPNLSSISDKYKGILLDAYGVFWGGNAFGMLPGSIEMMKKLVAEGKIVGILSNSTQLAHKEIDKLQQKGLVQGKHYHFLITSGEVARNLFLNDKLSFGKKFYLFGGPHPKFASHESIFKETGYVETADLDLADFIYLSVPHRGGVDQLDPEVFREDLMKIMPKKLPMVCPNPDQFAHEGNPPQAVVRQGSLAKMYQEMGGEVFYIGKPHARAFEAAQNEFRKFGLKNPSEIVMVGDTPETDIRGARAFGMGSALVTETGIMADRITRKGLEGAVNALGQADAPDHFIKRMGYGLRASL